MGERLGMGCPSPRDADDGTRALGALLWVGGSGGGLQGGGGDGWGSKQVSAILSPQGGQALKSQPATRSLS